MKPKNFIEVAREARQKLADAGIRLNADDTSSPRPREFTILGAPRTKKNSMRIVTNKRTGKAFPIQSAAHNTWAKSAVLQLKSQWGGREPLLVPVRMTATLYCERRGADMLNLLAAVSDALEAAGIIGNDRQVVSLDGCRMDKDAANPRVVVEVEPVG